MSRDEIWAYSLCTAIAHTEDREEIEFYTLWIYSLGFKFYFV
jgi:hypothetical protein